MFVDCVCVCVFVHWLLAVYGHHHYVVQYIYVQRLSSVRHDL